MNTNNLTSSNILLAVAILFMILGKFGVLKLSNHLELVSMLLAFLVVMVIIRVLVNGNGFNLDLLKSVIKEFGRFLVIFAIYLAIIHHFILNFAMNDVAQRIVKILVLYLIINFFKKME